MFNLFAKPSENRLGLDISSEGISFAGVKLEKSGCTLQFYGYKAFEREVNFNNPENLSVVTDTLKTIIEEYKADTRNTVISASGNAAFIKKITLPNLPIEELNVIVPQEAAKHLPLSANEFNIDFEILENTKRKDETSEKVDVVLCALSKSAARGWLDILSGAGYRVKAIDISSFAMITALAHSGMINEPGKTYVSVLIDNLSTDINVIQEGMPVFTYNIQAGKKNILESVANTLNKEKHEILYMLPDVALMVPGSEMSENQDLNRASSAARNTYSLIAGEIQKTIEFFRSESAEPMEVERIFIGGSGACVQNIDKYLSNKLRIETALFNPFINLSEEMGAQENLLYPVNTPSFSTCIGLALKDLK